MKSTLRTIPIIAAALIAFALPVFGQTATPAPSTTPAYDTAVSAYNDLAAVKPAPAPDQFIAAEQAIIATGDITPANKSKWSRALGHDLQKNKAAPGDVLAAYWQAVQLDSLGGYALVNYYLPAAIHYGDPYKATAISQVPALVAANPTSKYMLAAQAMCSWSTNQFDLAAKQWILAANADTKYTEDRGKAIDFAALCSKQRGDTPTQTNAIIVPMLTAYNVHYADTYFQKAYGEVYRSVGANAGFASVTALSAFLNNINSVVDTTAANKDFLSLVQSQLAAVTSNSN